MHNVKEVVRERRGVVALPTSRRLTYCWRHCLLVGRRRGVGAKEVHGSGMRREVPLTLAEVLAAEDHKDDVVMVVVTLVVAARMVEAYFDLLVFHDQLKRHSDVLHVLVPTLVALLNHSSAAYYCSMADLMVFDCALRTKVLLAEDVRLEQRVLDSRMGGKAFAHTVMPYSVRRAAAAVVLDP